ncbi:MAG TPA: hypothetical protein DCW74_05875 [Alteromonas australica]|uniref:Uncharacterized protein n=1 Tax=Alteromonas australica TaxID=589873 RepID=A0A350P1T4_9ALTE|nr:hypothetical protein [Alteromonas australica]|tara:strand:- start:539 stop:1066 length:528 start_codon:yes stop_codon:yes gene_type:complete
MAEENQQAPVEGQAPSPEQVGGAQMEEQQAQIQAIAESAPMPEKPFTQKAIKKLADAIDAFVEIAAPGTEKINYETASGKLNEPLPPVVYVPFVVTMTFIDQMPGFEKFVIQPETLTSDPALAKAAATFGMMAKDKKLVEALKAPPEGAAPQQGGGPDAAMPGETETDEEIMNMM